MKKAISIVLVIVTMFSFVNITKAETIRDLKKKLDKLLIESNNKKNVIKQTESQMSQTKGNINKIYSDMEYISSEIIMDYVQKNKRLLSNKYIKEYYNKLLKIY